MLTQMECQHITVRAADQPQQVEAVVDGIPALKNILQVPPSTNLMIRSLERYSRKAFVQGLKLKSKSTGWL
jgi:hypothetical protein